MSLHPHDPNEELRKAAEEEHQKYEEERQRFGEEHQRFEEEHQRFLNETKRTNTSFNLVSWVSLFSSLFLGACFLSVGFFERWESRHQFKINLLQAEYRGNISNIEKRIMKKEELRERFLLAMTKLRFIDEYIEGFCDKDKNHYWMDKRYEAYRERRDDHARYVSINSSLELTFNKEIFEKAASFSKLENKKTFCSQDLKENERSMRLKQAEIRADMENNIKTEMKLLEKERKRLVNLQEGKIK